MKTVYVAAIVCGVFVLTNFIVIEWFSYNQMQSSEIIKLKNTIYSLEQNLKLQRNNLSKVIKESEELRRLESREKNGRLLVEKKKLELEKKLNETVESLESLERRYQLSFSQTGTEETFLELDSSRNKTIIHIVPHAHLEAGRLMSMERKYRHEVKPMIDTLISALEQNRDRKFSWVEVVFLERWWREAREKEKERFIALCKRGQIELTMGGWVSADEAVTTFHEFINQMSLGHKFLQDEIGGFVSPSIGWQIDVAGMSAAVNTMFSQMCFDANFLSKIGMVERERRRNENSLDFIWRSSADLGSASDMLCQTIQWSPSCRKNFILKEESDVEKAAENFVEMIQQMIGKKSSKKNLIFPFGEDFFFASSNTTFLLLDACISKINREHKEFAVVYSTPSRYLKSLRNEDVKFPLLAPTRDFFPYKPNSVETWSGYYTTRPSFKKLCRLQENKLRSTELLFAWAFLKERHPRKLKADYPLLVESRQTNAIMQSHNSISGTSTEDVLEDYKKLLSKANQNLNLLMEKSINVLTSTTQPRKFLQVDESTCCEVTVEVTNEVVIFNPLAWKRTEIICLMTDDPKIRITDERGRVLPVQQIDPHVYWRNGQIFHSPSSFKLYASIELDPLEYKFFNFKRKNYLHNIF